MGTENASILFYDVIARQINWSRRRQQTSIFRPSAARSSRLS